MVMDTRRPGRRPSDGGLPLAEPRWLAERRFRQDDVPAVRRFAEAFGARAGLRSARLADFVLAASEAAACAIAWGPCVTRVRFWMTGRRAFCEVRGDARIMRRATQGSARHGAACWPGATARGGAGRGPARPSPARPSPVWPGAVWPGDEPPDGVHGEAAALRRWVLKQVCDYVSVASGPDGAWVLLSVSADGG
jgi:hypothetical protein